MIVYPPKTALYSEGAMLILSPLRNQLDVIDSP